MEEVFQNSFVRVARSSESGHEGFIFSLFFRKNVHGFFSKTLVRNVFAVFRRAPCLRNGCRIILK